MVVILEHYIVFHVHIHTCPNLQEKIYFHILYRIKKLAIKTLANWVFNVMIVDAPITLLKSFEWFRRILNHFILHCQVIKRFRRISKHFIFHCFEFAFEVD